MGIDIPDPAKVEMNAAAEAAVSALSSAVTAAVVEGGHTLDQAGVLAGVAMRRLLRASTT